MNLIKLSIKISLYLRISWSVILQPTYLRSLGATIGREVRLLGAPLVFIEKGANIQIGAHCVLCSDSSMTALGLSHPVVLRAINPGALISVGENTGISGATIVAAKQIKIGRECLIGANVIIVDTDFHTIAPLRRRFNSKSVEIGTAPVEIGDNVFIGANSIILKGVTIGTNSVVGAGSVVTRNVPSNAVVAGNPANIIRML